MSLYFLTSGLLTTVQDAGRTNFRRLGINPNGVMDARAARLINCLLGNDDNDGVLEMHFPAPKISFEENAQIALGGADFAARLNHRLIENWRPIQVRTGDVLTFERKIFGARVYLTVRGGFKIEQWLGSVSTNLKAQIGGLAGRPIQKGDKIFFKQNQISIEEQSLYKISTSLLPPYSASPTVRVTAGAEWNRLTKESAEGFSSQTFTIRPESDRMGFRLGGEPLGLQETLEMISSAVNFGTIQLLPDGQLIVLMADCQTTGGYPRVAHVSAEDLPLLAQLGANDKVRFRLISLPEAENLVLEFEKNLDLLKTAARLKLC